MNAKKNINQLFLPSGCLKEEAIRKYISAQLSKSELDEAKKHIDECELCNQAIKGAQLVDQDKYRDAVIELNKKLRSSKSFTRKGKLSERKLKRRTYYSIAASIALLFGIVFWFSNDRVSYLSSHILTEEEILQITYEYELIEPEPPALQYKSLNENMDIINKHGVEKDIVLLIENDEKNIQKEISMEELKKYNLPVSVLSNIAIGKQVLKVCFDVKGELKEIDLVVNSGFKNGTIATVLPSDKKLIKVNEKELRRVRYSFPVMLCQ